MSEHIPIGQLIETAQKEAESSMRGLCAKCKKDCPKVTAITKKYTEVYGRIMEQMEELKQQLPKEKPNVLGAGRKPKFTPQMLDRMLELKSDKLSFGDIAKKLSEEFSITVSKSSVYENYLKLGNQ